jgi:tetratricopeptide (TPR) repeat protein
MNESESLIEKKLHDIDSLQKAKKFEEAIEVCNEIIADDDECYMAYSKRGDIFYGLGMHQDAFRDLDKLMEIRPECPSAYYVSARWNLELGNDKSAIDDANFVIKSGVAYFINMAYFFRSIAFLNLGDKKAAAEDCLLLPEEFKTAVTIHKIGWKILSRDDLYKMINS